MATYSAARFAPVRLGVIGLGRFGRLHALTASGVAEALLVAAVDTNEDRLSKISKELEDLSCWTDLDRAMSESEAEAWIVATSTVSHIPVTQKLLAAGKSVLVEKPLAENVAAAESLAPLVHVDSSNLMLGHVVLFNSEFQQLLGEVRQRGPIAYIDCVRHRPKSTLDSFPGESPFHLTMVHDLYQLVVLMNRADPVRVSAQVHRTADGRCDLALAQLAWESGTIASLTASFMTPPGLASDGFDRLELFGEGWAGRLQPNPRPIQIWDEGTHWPLAHEIQAHNERPPSGMLAEQLRCFCRVVRGVQKVPLGATYEDGLQVLRWVQRLQDAACR